MADSYTSERVRLDIPLREIEPDFSLLTGKDSIEGAFRVLTVRRNILARQRDMERSVGRRMQRQGDADALRERLASPEEMPAHRRLHLEGRLREAEADVAYYRELERQFDLEIAVYERALRGCHGLH